MTCLASDFLAYQENLSSLNLHLFPALTRIKNGFLHWSHIDSLSLHLPSLTHVDNTFLDHANVNSARLDLPALTHIGRFFCMDATVPSLITHFPALTHTEQFFLAGIKTTAVHMKLPALIHTEEGFLSGIQAQTIHLTAPNLTHTSISFLAYNKAHTLTVEFSKLTHMGEGFLRFCKMLNTLNLSGLEGVTEIGSNAFLGCQTLNDLSRQHLRAFYDRVNANPEGKILPPLFLSHSFSPDTYLLYNPDVRTEAVNQGVDPLVFAKEHYQTTGFKEVRQCSPPFDFKVETYLLFNDDVKSAALTQENPKKFALWHFITHATKENRLYKFELPDGFTPTGYLA